MDISASFSEDRLTIKCCPHEEDRAFWEGRKARIGRDTAEFSTPEGKAELHPDALALLALLIFGPFAAKKINFDWAVSPDFAETVKAFFRRTILPVDPAIKPRSLPLEGRDALAFSGGVDSVAALALLPDSTIPIFMNRVLPEGAKAGLYRQDAALRSCRSVENSGREMVVVNTTMEYTRDPVGFAVDWTNAAGAVLLSEAMNIRSVSFGMIAESAFFIGHPHYSDLSTRSVYKAWAPLFEVVGIPISLPTCGLSEVVTTSIANHVSHLWYSQSCVRGTEEKPCGRCFKCFRKTIIDARVSGQELPPSHFDIAYSSAEVRRRLLEVPIHHENVLAFSIHGLNSGSHEILDALYRKTEPIFKYGNDLSFCTKMIPRGLDYIPTFIRGDVAERISHHAGVMNDDELSTVLGWDTIGLTKTDQYQAAQEDLTNLLNGK